MSIPANVFSEESASITFVLCKCIYDERINACRNASIYESMSICLSECIYAYMCVNKCVSLSMWMPQNTLLTVSL